MPDRVRHDGRCLLCCRGQLIARAGGVGWRRLLCGIPEDERKKSGGDSGSSPE